MIASRGSWRKHRIDIPTRRAACENPHFNSDARIAVTRNCYCVIPHALSHTATACSKQEVSRLWRTAHSAYNISKPLSHIHLIRSSLEVSQTRDLHETPRAAATLEVPQVLAVLKRQVHNFLPAGAQVPRTLSALVSSLAPHLHSFILRLGGTAHCMVLVDSRECLVLRERRPHVLCTKRIR